MNDGRSKPRLCSSAWTAKRTAGKLSFGRQELQTTAGQEAPSQRGWCLRNTVGGLFECSGLQVRAYALVNLVTALVPSDTACLASSPGRIRRTDVWISRLVTVGFLL